MFKQDKIFFCLFIILVFCFGFLVFLPNIPKNNTLASCTTPSTTPALLGTGTTGGGNVLVTAPIANLATNSLCVTSSTTSVPSFSFPSFDDLKSLYYTQSKASQSLLYSVTSMSADTAYDITGNLTISSGATISHNGVVFVEGNLYLNANPVNNPSSSSGLIFIVKGDINISPAVTQIDAFLVTFGVFCSSWISPACSPSSNALTINGSVISLGLDSSTNTPYPPKFVRSLADNSVAAEKIVFKPKYLVILKDLLGRNQNIWSEVR